LGRKPCSQSSGVSEIIEGLNGVETIKGNANEETELENIEREYIKSLRIAFREGMLTNAQGAISGVIGAIGNLILMYFGVLQVINNEITLGTLMAFMTLSGYFMDPVQRLVGLQLQIQEANISIWNRSDFWYGKLRARSAQQSKGGDTQMRLSNTRSVSAGKSTTGISPGATTVAKGFGMHLFARLLICVALALFLIFSVYCEIPSLSLKSFAYQADVFAETGQENETATEEPEGNGLQTIPVMDIELGDYKGGMAVGETQELSAAVLPLDATDQTISYSSDDGNVATVSSN
jgi:hypothetical protein